MNDNTYCALLRGVNVNGRTMKMAEVCDVFRAAGMADVTSVLASGNIIFHSDHPQVELRGVLESAMTSHYDDTVNLFIKNASEIREILKELPFAESPELHIYSFICEPMFETVLLDAFNKITPAPNEKACINNGNFYWQCAKGATLDSGFSKILGRKEMKDKFTSRNIGTLGKIQTKMQMFY